MRFGKTLREAVYEPWKDKYIDYGKLKELLHEERLDDEGSVAWTEEDENRFCDEIFNVQLEKVARFQQERFDALKQRVDAAFDRLKELAPPNQEEQQQQQQQQQQQDQEQQQQQQQQQQQDQEQQQQQQQEQEQQQQQQQGDDKDTDKDKDKGKGKDHGDARLRQLEKDVDDITNEVRELKKYSSINYTGFLKIVKKHDRKRGDRYRVRPMMQLSLAQRPFNSEQAYSPLLNKLSIMYFAMRQQREGGQEQPPLDLDAPGETHKGERYTASKFWVHPDNLLEVKTLILRHLPALVYSEQSAKELDANNSPPITSLYFDNGKFDLYSEKVERQSEASSLRLRWYGQLSSRPEIFVEQKTADAKGNSREYRFTIKDKWVKAFLDGKYGMEKSVHKMERQGASAEQIDEFKQTVARIHGFLQQKKLSPVLRANYSRTAFQKPADDRVRISIDTDVAFVREDRLDADRPCRDPNDWHRADIDSSNMTYPFGNINQSEVSKFPYAVLEIKLRDEGNRKRYSWVEDLTSSHLVHPAPRFSKFVHGVASLFEDYVNNLPFWLSDLERDIRKDPQRAFEEEEQRRAQRAQDVNAVGSLIGTKGSSYKATQSSPVGKSYLTDRMAADSRASPWRALPREADASQQRPGYGTLSAVIPGLSLSKYARARRGQKVPLPEGVVKPTEWLKNMGEIKVEPKVWLANERTFLKWQHICILQGGLAIGLYTAAGKDTVAEAMGILYVAIAAFAGIWGYAMLRTRRTMILERSGKDFDNMLGPIVISLALMAALVINFVLAYRKAFAKLRPRGVNDTMRDELG